jgi:segregation and condensation protein A
MQQDPQNPGNRPQDDFWNVQESRTPPGQVMYVDVDGYEGPLDLLLDLARKQKVDLASISVLALAEQYLAFIEKIRESRIEIAADYLVMAAWLAYLKSRLMVPHTDDEEELSGEEMAAQLQFRLQRLEAMRDAARRLMNRDRLGRDFFARGMPEPIALHRERRWEASYFELLKAYAIQRERNVPHDYVPVRRVVWSLHDAEEILTRLLGAGHDWAPIHEYLADYLATAEERATVIASSFTASLELVRRGEVELRQGHPFGPLMLRKRRGGPPPETE